MSNHPNRNWRNRRDARHAKWIIFFCAFWRLCLTTRERWLVEAAYRAGYYDGRRDAGTTTKTISTAL